MTSVGERILELGQKRDTQELTQYVCSLETKQISDFIKAKISDSNFTFIWNYLLASFTDQRQCHVKRFQIVKDTLHHLRNNDLPILQVNGIVCQLCMELVKFKDEHLIELAESFMHCLQTDKITECWKDLLPEILKVLNDKPTIYTDAGAVSGMEFRKQLINRICSMQWSPNIVTTLASMFINIQMSKEDHLKVCQTLAKYVEKLIPEEIPPFAFHMLKLCKQHTSNILFRKLLNYFTLRVYNNYQLPDSGTPDLDAIEDYSNQAAIEAESTVLVHVYSAASSDEESIRDYLHSLQKVSRVTEFILNPFNLNVLLAISTVEFYEDTVFEIVRPCISRMYNEEQIQRKSKWFCDVVQSSVKIEETLGKIIQLSIQERETLLKGLINLGFLLLGVGAGLGRDTIAENQWNLGAFILFKIIKRNRQLAPAIIQRMAGQIITSQAVTQYVECLYRLSKTVTLLMIENKATMIDLMENLPQISGNNSKQLIDALVPLGRISSTLRDQFIVMLRKSLFSRVPETREMAVMGFLKLMSSLKITNPSALSQNSGSFSSGHSFLTQMSLNRSSQLQSSAFTNEAICFECLSILRRCFVQQADVKVTLYKGLYEAACANNELAKPILELLWSHFVNFYELDEEVLPPVKVQQICVTKDTNVTLQEPLGHLIFAMGLITCRMTEDNERYVKTLDSLSSRMINSELVHFELDDGTDLLDVMPESQLKLLILKETISIYEALIGYKMLSWTNDTDNAQDVNSLYVGLARLQHFSKDVIKPKKVAGRKKKGENTQTQSTANNTTLKSSASSKAKHMKLSPTLLNFPVIVKTLQLLHEPSVTWTTTTKANVLKSKQEFHQYIMQATVNILTDLKPMKLIDYDIAKNYYEYLCDIAVILYERIINRFEDFLDFDTTSGLYALEAFHRCFNIVCNKFKTNFKGFLSRVYGSELDDISSLLNGFISTFKKIFEIDYDEVGMDNDTKKIPLVIVNILSSLVQQMPVHCGASELLEWLKDIALNTVISNKLVAPAFISLIFDVNLKFKMDSKFLEEISMGLGTITGFLTKPDEGVDEYKLLTPATVNYFMTSLTGAVKSVLDDVDFVLARLKCTALLVNIPGQETEKSAETLRTMERQACCQLCTLAPILCNLCNCTVPPGNLSESTLKTLVAFYSSLLGLSRHFQARATRDAPAFQAAHFERLVKACGKLLAPAFYDYVCYLESNQQVETGKRGSEGAKSRILRESKLIPKVIYEMEQFAKIVMQLSKKTGVDLSRLVGQGTVRDFRIKSLDQVLERARNDNDDDDEENENGEGDDDSRDGSVATETTLDESIRQGSDDDGDESSPPPTKKSKR